jgi:hypothetical protein
MTVKTIETPTIHYHDLGITISASDLEAGQLAAMRAILEREVQALVERVNVETSALTGCQISWSVTFDGSRQCGEHV